MKHIFFDWDRTLWDFDKNSALALNEVYTKYNLDQNFSSFDEFNKIYHKFNDKLWTLYRKGEIKKAELSIKRFSLTFAKGKIQDQEFAKTFSEEYLEATTTKTELFPNAKETLEYLNKNYQLHIITNGFTEVQFIKIKNSGLGHFFKEIITSEEAGALKPNRKIFDLALSKTGAKLEDSILIGDDLEADIIGAMDFGMKNIYFNYSKKKHNIKATHEINELSQIKSIL